MKAKLFLSLVLLMSAGAAPVTTSKIVGDYVEARTASVFAGACHYNGELVTTGRDAVLAWNITAGSWKGIDLSGIRAMAAISSEANLGDEKAIHRCELAVDASATAIQTAAFVEMLKSQSNSQLGSIISVRRAIVTFADNNRAYNVQAAGFGSIAVQPMPDDECCKQPSLVWYSPLFQLDQRKVGFTTGAAYTGGVVGDAWQLSGDNSAFYGSFTY